MDGSSGNYDKDCPACNGTGSLTGSASSGTCLACGGTGQISTLFVEDEDN